MGRTLGASTIRIFLVWQWRQVAAKQKKGTAYEGVVSCSRRLDMGKFGGQQLLWNRARERTRSSEESHRF